MKEEKNQSAVASPRLHQRVNRRGFCKDALAATVTAVAAQQLGAEERPNQAACSSTPTVRMKQEFKPGDKVPVSGIYDVVHDKLDGEDHALPHQVTAIAGKVFPPCRWCGAEVRFHLHSDARHVEADTHFKS
jgi:hypothetical protein